LAVLRAAALRLPATRCVPCCPNACTLVKHWDDVSLISQAFGWNLACTNDRRGFRSMIVIVLLLAVGILLAVTFAGDLRESKR
jgi:hypothetical protein